MLLKLFGLGILEYFDDRFNQFDFLVVISSIVELIIDAKSGACSRQVSAACEDRLCEVPLAVAIIGCVRGSLERRRPHGSLCLEAVNNAASGEMSDGDDDDAQEL
eukprot:993945-Rhodomonas_salina.1